LAAIKTTRKFVPGEALEAIAQNFATVKKAAQVRGQPGYQKPQNVTF